MSTAVGAKGGSPAPPPPDPECEQLKKANEAARAKATKEMEKASDDDLSPSAKASLTEALEKAKKGGMTFSSAKISINTGNGRSMRRTMTASSSGKAAEKHGGLAGNAESQSGMRAGNEAVMCEPPKYKHESSNGYGSHAEAKIANEITELAKSRGGVAPGGKMLLNIDWRYDLKSTKSTHQSGMPCRHCFKLLCHAASNCGIEVMICDKDGQPQPLKDFCKRPKTSYRKFDKKIDKWTKESDFKMGQLIRGKS